MAYPQHRLSRAHKHFARTAGDLTLNSATWVDLPTIGATWDLSLRARVGDTIEAGVLGRLGAEAFFTGIDVVTMVAGAFVSSFTTQTTTRPSVGASIWRAPNSQEGISGSGFYTLTSGDIDGSIVTLRLQYSQASAGNKTLYAGTAVSSFQFFAKNLGPPA